jgi:hypothetical protein
LLRSGKLTGRQRGNRALGQGGLERPIGFPVGVYAHEWRRVVRCDLGVGALVGVQLVVGVTLRHHIERICDWLLKQVSHVGKASSDLPKPHYQTLEINAQSPPHLQLLALLLTHADLRAARGRGSISDPETLGKGPRAPAAAAWRWTCRRRR